MSIVFSSKITSLVINPTYQDASGNEFPYTILKVKWQLTGTRNGVSASIYPETILEEPTNETQFVDYNSLTEQQILDWVFATDTCISNYKSYITDKLNEISLITISNFHWETV